MKKALELIPRAELLLRDPATFVAERERERRVADGAAGLPASAARPYEQDRAPSRPPGPPARACYDRGLPCPPTSSSVESASTT